MAQEITAQAEKLLATPRLDLAILLAYGLVTDSALYKELDRLQESRAGGAGGSQAGGQGEEGRARNEEAVLVGRVVGEEEEVGDEEGSDEEESEEEESEEGGRGAATGPKGSREAMGEEEVEVVAQVGEHVPSSPAEATRQGVVIEITDTPPHQSQLAGVEGAATSSPSEDREDDRFLKELRLKLGEEGMREREVREEKEGKKREETEKKERKEREETEKKERKEREEREGREKREREEREVREKEEREKGEREEREKKEREVREKEETGGEGEKRKGGEGEGRNGGKGEGGERKGGEGGEGEKGTGREGGKKEGREGGEERRGEGRRDGEGGKASIRGERGRA